MQLVRILTHITLMDVITTTAMLCSIVGNIYVNLKKTKGMYLWFFGSLLWLGFAMYYHIWTQVLMYVVYTVCNIHGIWHWRKDHLKTNEISL